MSACPKSNERLREQGSIHKEVPHAASAMKNFSMPQSRSTHLADGSQKKQKW